MRILMLGWEFPPFITGGLGTACQGLTRALSRHDVQVTFVLPKPVGGELQSEQVKILAPQSPKAAQGDRSPQSVSSTYAMNAEHEPIAGVTFKAVPSMLRTAYTSRARIVAAQGQTSSTGIGFVDQPTGDGGQGIDDLIDESARYAKLCVDLAAGEDFDVIHAHDWFTFPAGQAVAKATGKPLVVHLHSTEYDRAGEGGNARIVAIEKAGLAAASRVITVSYLTRSILEKRYGVEGDRIDVVHNGIDRRQPANEPASPPPTASPTKRDKIVLFLGRVTMQKGPEYFVAAAKKVLEKYPRVKFLIAGSGDQMPMVVRMAVSEGIGNRVLFTGFLHGSEVERVYRMADVYVMPSVSEPFGIATLEAISHDVPVIISRNAGVGEVLKHALKVDFWDVDDMADKIIAMLRHRPLSSMLRENAGAEITQLTWDGAARRCLGVYQRAIATTPTAA